MEWILSYNWPGNVRELKNAVERAVIMSHGSTITVDDIVPRHLRSTGDSSGSVTLPVGSTMADARRQMVLRTFSMTGGDAETTAKMLGMRLAEVRSELAALVGSNGHGHESEAAAPAKKSKSSSAPKERAGSKGKSRGRR
jgi:DNA-binding NtrC family response regulator